MRFRLGLSIVFCITVCLAQQVVKLNPGSSSYIEIVSIAKIEFQKNAAFPIKTPRGTVRRAGAWAYIRDVLTFVDPRHVGDGEGVALLKLRNGRWRIVEATVGSGGFEDLGKQWTKRYKLPKGLAK